MTLERATLRDLPKLKGQLDRLADGITSIEVDVRILDRFAIVSRDEGTLRDPSEAALQQVAAVQDAIESARRAVESAREGAARLDVDRPETLDAREDPKTRAGQLRRLSW